MAKPRKKTFLSIQVGRRLREFREAAGVLGAELAAAELVRDVGQLSRLEAGFGVTLTAKAIGDLCDFYGMTANEKYMTQDMYRRVKEDAEWWEPYSQVMFRDIALLFSLERYANRIHIYDTLVNGLFQTENYAKMMHPKGDPETILKMVELRMNRQADFRGRASLPDVQLMMCESALHGACDQEQVDHLVQLDQRSGMTIRYLPTSAGPQPYLKGPFSVLRFEGTDPDVVYSESISGARYEDRPAAVEAHLNTFASHFEDQARSIKEF